MGTRPAVGTCHGMSLRCHHRLPVGARHGVTIHHAMAWSYITPDPILNF
ncbi:MAG: hypothetical protein WCK09_18090 [Bacteroidota bacterium]